MCSEIILTSWKYVVEVAHSLKGLEKKDGYVYVLACEEGGVRPNDNKELGRFLHIIYLFLF